MQNLVLDQRLSMQPDQLGPTRGDRRQDHVKVQPKTRHEANGIVRVTLRRPGAPVGLFEQHRMEQGAVGAVCAPLDLGEPGAGDRGFGGAEIQRGRRIRVNRLHEAD